MKLFFHLQPARMVCFSIMGLWIDVWDGFTWQRELIPNITKENLDDAFKTCLGTEPKWWRWLCPQCGATTLPVYQAEDHPFTAEVFSQAGIAAAKRTQAGEVYQAVQQRDTMYVVLEADA